MNVVPLRPAWWILMCGLISTLSLTYVLPVLGQHTADYTPSHQHYVTGASTTAERNQVLAEHTHGGVRSPAHPPPFNSVPTVYFLPNPGAAVAGNAGVDGSPLCLACSGAPLLDSMNPLGPSAPPAIWQWVTTSPMLGAWLSGSPPVQPPR